MYDLIFLGIGLLLALIFVGVGLLKGRKQVRTFAWIKLAATALALIVSLLFSALLARAISAISISSLAKSGVLGDLGQMLKDAPILGEAIGALIAMILAPFLFFWLFLIIKAILNFIARRVAKTVVLKTASTEAEVQPAQESESKKVKKFAMLRSEKSEPIGMLCGALCGLLIFFAFMVPVVGTMTTVHSAMGLMTASATDDTTNTVVEIVDSSANNAGAKAFRVLGGDLTYSLMTTQVIDGNFVSLPKEMRFLAAASEAIQAISSQELSSDEVADTILSVKEPFADSSLLPTVIPSFLSSAESKWNNGEAFLGIKSPFAAGSASGVMFTPVLHTFAEADDDAMREDGETLIEIMAIAAREGVLSKLKSDPLHLFADHEFSAGVIYEILESEHMCPLVGDVANGALSLLGDKVGIDMSTLQFDTSNIQNPEHEADVIATALAEAISVVDYMAAHHSVDAEVLRRLGPLLDAFSQTEMAGKETTKQILLNLLKTEKIQASLGFSDAEILVLADTIQTNADTIGYTQLMESAGRAMELIKLSAQLKVDVAQMNLKVNDLLEIMTPAAAQVLQIATTPNLMIKQGVPAQSAQKTSDVISNLFGNLADAKQAGMSEEDYQRESVATTNMLNMAMNVKRSSGSTSLFGEDGSMGKSADQFVQEVFNSSVISQTMVDTVYENGSSSEPVQNPLGSKRQLKDTEKEELEGALNNQWSAASDEQRADQKYQQQYIALGSMMNAEVEMTDNQVTIK